MKKRTQMILSFACLSTLWLSACQKEDEGLRVQSHDENVMMGIMHEMMMEMDKMPPIGDPDRDFAMMMKTHHQGAINMAKKELQSGDDAQMKAFAQRIIDAQQAEINQFNAYLATAPVLDTTGTTMFQMKQMMAMQKMTKASDLRVLTGDTDIDFVSLMIDHHQSAIESSQAELDYGNEDAIKNMAKTIMKDQQKEISEMQEWLLKNKPY